MDLIWTVGKTEDTTPREEMGKRGVRRETHGPVSLWVKREGGGDKGGEGGGGEGEGPREKEGRKERERWREG